MGSYLSKGKHQSDEDWVRNPYIADMIMSQDVNAWHERTSLIEMDNPKNEKDCVSVFRQHPHSSLISYWD